MDNLFNGNPADAQQPAAPAAQQPSQVNPYADQLAAIKAEDGRQKYADVKTALDSIPHAQKYISELDAQLKAAQSELEKRKGMEEMLAAMQATTQPVQPSGQAFDASQIASLVNTTLDARTRAEAEQRNGNRVRDQLVSLYGEKAEEMFNKRAQELGVDPAYLTMQAKAYPDFVLAQFNTKAPSSPQPVIGSVNTTHMPQAPVEIKPVIRSATTKSAVEQYRAIAQNLAKNQ